MTNSQFFQSTAAPGSAPYLLGVHCALVARDMRSSGISYTEALRVFLRRYIIEVLAAEGFHLGRTSRQLGVHPNTLTRTTRDLRINVAEIRMPEATSIQARSPIEPT